MKRLFVSLLLILLFSLNAYSVGIIKVEGETTYQSLTPSLLTLYKGLSLIPGDTYAVSTGSQVGKSGVNYETFDPNNGAICLWYYPYNNGNAGQLRYLFDGYVDASNRLSIYISAANNLTLYVIGAGTTRTASTSFATIKPFTWNHIVCTWSKNVDVNATNNSYIYLNGSGAGQTSATTAMTSVPVNFYIGSDYLGLNGANGILAYKIMRNWMSSDQVTADYNAGSGSLEFVTRTPHAIALGLTSENSTGVSYVHRGKQYSAITDGATEDTVTTVVGSDKSFADNDQVNVSAGNGYSSNAIGNTFVDGTPSSTSLAVDDGTGADTGELEKIGKGLSFDGVNDWVQTTTLTPNIPANGPATISGWYYFNQLAPGSTYKGFNDVFYQHTSGNIYIITTPYGASFFNPSIALYTWYHIVLTYSGPTATAKLYVNGVLYNVYTQGFNETIPALSLLKIGTWGSNYFFNGLIDDVRIYNRALSANEVLWEATHPSCSFAELHVGIVVGTHETTLTAQANSGQKVLTVTDSSTFTANEIIRIVGATPETVTIASIDSPTQMTTVANLVNTAANGSAIKFSNLVLFHKYSDGLATDLSIYGNNGTLNGGVTYAQTGFLSRNLFTDGDFRDGIGAFPTLSGVTFSKNTTAPIADEQDGKLVNSGAAQGYIRQNIKTTANKDYYFYGLVKGPATVNGASTLVNVDATASMSITAAQAGLTAATTTETEFCFQAKDTDTTVDLGTGSVTNAEITYWDNVKMISSLCVNGSCEGGADPPASWTQETNATVVSDTTPHAGTNCLKVTAGAVNVGAKQSITLVSGQYYTICGYVKATAGDSAGIYMDTGTGTIVTIGTTTSTTWTRIRGSFKAVGTAGVIYCRGIANTDVVWFDDVALIRDDIGTVTYTKGSGIIPSNQPYILR